MNEIKLTNPAYVLHEEQFRKNMALIQHVSRQSGAEIIMALKAFSLWSVFPIVAEYIGAASASSLYEAKLITKHMGVKAHTYSPAFFPTDFGEICEHSSHIIFNSLNQFEQFYPQVKKSGLPISVGLRINPQFSEVTPLIYNACSPGSRLGMVADELPEQLPAEIKGLHFHTLCESNSYDLEKTLLRVEQQFGKYFHQLEWINFGGGHLMTHKDYDTLHLIGLLKAFKAKHRLHVIMEPGSAFAWQTGHLYAHVLDIVENKNIRTAILDVSFTAHMPDCLEMPYKPKITGATDAVAGKPTYRMAGNSCLSGDFMGDWSFDHELKIGDRIIFEDMIHYTMVKTTMFNGVNHPDIALYTQKGELKILRRFGFSDFESRLS